VPDALRELANLTTLNLCQNKLTELPESFGKLKELTTLDLGGNPLSAVPDVLLKLTNLTTLDLTYTKITDLRPLLELRKLEYLSVWGSGVDLPEELKLSREAQKILAFVRESQGAKTELPLCGIKLLLLGQGRVGKSHVRQRLFGEDPRYHRPEQTPTHDVACVFGRLQLSVKALHELPELMVNVYDFGGQNELHGTHRFFLGAQRCFYLLVLRADWPADGEGEDSNRLNYWLRTIACHGRYENQRAPVLIVITQCDRIELPEAETAHQDLLDALDHAKRNDWYGANVVADPIDGFGWSRIIDNAVQQMIDARHDKAVESLRNALKAHANETLDLGRRISEDFFRVIEHCDHAFDRSQMDGDGRGVPYFNYRTSKPFQDCFRNVRDWSDEQRDGLQRAHLTILKSLGVLHWVGDLPETFTGTDADMKEIVFNPEWLRHPTYKLIRYQDCQLPGVLTSEDLKRALPAPQQADTEAKELYRQMPFTERNRDQILGLMCACKLAFQGLPPEGYVIPDLLKPSQPEPPESGPGVWRVLADYLPEKIFLRLLADRYSYILKKNEQCYRNKATFQIDRTEVCIRAFYSPPNGERPFLQIVAVPKDPGVSERIATKIEDWVSDIYKKEGLKDVKRELVAWTDLSPPASACIFKCTKKKDANKKRGKQEVEWTICFRGKSVDMARITATTGLKHLHRLIRNKGKGLHADVFFQSDRPANAQPKSSQSASAAETPYSIGGGKQKTLSAQERAKVVEAIKGLKAWLKNEMDEDRREYLEEQIRTFQEHLDEAQGKPERTKNQKNPANTVQTAITRTLEQLKDVLRELHEHLLHCKEMKEGHFLYQPDISIEWELY
jgi:hypothetical protein